MKTTCRNTFLSTTATFLAAVAFLGCQPAGGLSAGSETHFLKLCTSDASCGDQLSCECGACTSPCTSSEQCELSGASCTATDGRPLSQSCAEPQVQVTCEVVCDESTDCTGLGEDYVCDRGLCRRPPNDCVPGRFSGEDFVLLGDNFLASSGQVTQELQELMMNVGTLSSGEMLRDYSSDVVTPFGGAEDLFSQYEQAQAEGPFRVAIFDAGGPDALLDCDTSSEELCSNLQIAVDGTQSLLSRMADDGVDHVVLFFYPRPDEEALAVKFELLASELSAVCAASPIPCIFLPLAPLFEQNRSAWLTGDGLFPTEAGSEVAAGALFDAMQAQCLVP